MRNQIGLHDTIQYLFMQKRVCEKDYMDDYLIFIKSCPWPQNYSTPMIMNSVGCTYRFPL